MIPSRRLRPGHLPTRPPPPEAERRQLTVMFADLVGSTELSQNLDPEDLRNVDRAYQDAAKAAIETSGGYVARYMGDGVLAYFGYPQAHEDDAERAVRAGLTLTQTVKNLDIDVPLAVRVGIATGPVVVGDIVGVGASQESAVVGETPNLAARLQGEAKPNTVVISEPTMVLTAGLFEHQALGARTLKGFSQAASIYRVGEEIRGQSRFIARSGSHLSLFVGREDELGLLSRRWLRAKDSQGQAVLVMGEPGIGKSRLLARLLDLISGEPHVIRSWQCSPYHENSTLYPLIATFERLLRFGEFTEEGTRLEALRDHVTDLGQIETLGLLAHLLSIPTGGRFPDIERMAAPQRREHTLRALVDYIAHPGEQTPVVCVFEDVHWADPTTRELLGRLVEAIAARPVLLIATTRQGFAARWTDSAHVHLHNLSRLGPREGEQLARGLTSIPGALAVDVIDAVLSRAEGNPLFIEELTRSILQLSGSVTPNHMIPTTIQDSLMARIDASATGKMVAQCASVIGRTFESSLLEAIWDRPAEQLDDGLAALQQVGLIYPHGEVASRTFIFKHALARDTAYDSLLRAKRQKLHGRIAEVLRGDFPDVAMTQPELVARHFTEAGQVHDAIQHWLQAGRRALEGSANQEAAEHLQSGLALVEALPESTERSQLELSLLVALHGPVMVTEGWLSDETVRTYTRAEVLCEQLGEREQLQPVLHGQWVQRVMRGDVLGAREMALRFMRAGPASDDVTTLRGEVMLGWTALFHGELSGADSHFVSALGL